MTATFPNYINGRTLDSAERSADINPSNLTDVVGEFAGPGDPMVHDDEREFRPFGKEPPQELADRPGRRVIEWREVGHDVNRLLPGLGIADRDDAPLELLDLDPARRGMPGELLEQQLPIGVA